MRGEFEKISFGWGGQQQGINQCEVARLCFSRAVFD
jgi:hypothetical protein